MEGGVFHLLASKPVAPPNLALAKPTCSRLFSPNRPQHLKVTPICSSSDGGSSTSPDTTDGNSAPTPTDTAGVRFKKRSRKRAKQQREGEGSGERFMKAEAAVPKKWEDMSLGEQALELYLGEKGLLYWINKFAYASIFIVIGAWILFRFVGPALNLYQLDSAPLSPAAILKGS
ncbi:uncharacterized protein LOC126789148 [Argentina anserina]|uniref:uncharacterized protein LOC126789148 n=1 Tax=Argentina anserina TaxID=57926 RepID=UPI00217674BD|nr:uncharacterized protein LOC126789148 [Potentilla anserina]